MNEQPVAGTEGVQEGAGSPIAVHDLQKHGIEVGQRLPPAMRSYVEGHAGSMKRNVAPVVSDSAQMRPRCACTMERDMDSPRPIPSALVVNCGRSTKLFASDRHLADEDRADPHAPAYVDVIADRRDVAVHVLEIARDGDLVHRDRPARRSPPSNPRRRANSRRSRRSRPAP